MTLDYFQAAGKEMLLLYFINNKLLRIYTVVICIYDFSSFSLLDI